MLKPVTNPRAMLSRMVQEIGEIGAGVRGTAHPVSVVDGDNFSVRMEVRQDMRWAPDESDRAVISRIRDPLPVLGAMRL